MKSSQTEKEQIKQGELINDKGPGKIGLVRPFFWAFDVDVNKGSSRRPNKTLEDSQRDIPYINHLANGLMEEVSDEMNYWDVIQDMQDREKIPLLEQIGGSCVFYSAWTAVQILTKERPEIKKLCNKDWEHTNMDKEFGPILKKYKGVLNSKSYIANQAGQLQVRRDILKHLKNNLILAGGHTNISKDREYTKIEDKMTKIPVFNFVETQGGHNICIVGCYKDKKFGNCFITKMTNERDNVGIPNGFGKIETLCYALLPFKYFDGSYYSRTKKGKQGKKLQGPEHGLSITEFGYVPITHDITSEMSELKF